MIVAQVQLVGRLAAGFALQIAALLDLGLLVWGIVGWFFLV